MTESTTEPVPAVNVGTLDDIPVGEGRAFAVDGRQIAVFRLRSGAVRALDAVCPHRGGPLADGLLDEAVVVCPLHGHTFEFDTGRDLTDDSLQVCAYEVLVAADGTIAVSVPRR